jgi:hypothetical protein
VDALLTMDDKETVEGAVKKKCGCGGFFKVAKNSRVTKTEVVCDSCSRKTGE